MNLENELQQSLSYLNSAEALRSLEADAYWPKWNSTWWHMSLLHEMGETKQIPEAVIKKYIVSLNKIPLKIFPILPEETPPGTDPYRGGPCHCQLGNVYQVLAHWGVDVDKELPWIRPWFLKYQMADGGFNCSNDAYLVKDEVPSSMVGTISAFEAVLLYTKRPWTGDEKIFLDKGARFLIERKLMQGSQTKYNAEERDEANAWVQLCFPRFYLYDVLRGLNALLLWAEKTNQAIPKNAISEVVTYIDKRFPDGNIRIERQSYAGVGTIMQSSSGEWLTRQPASFYPLLDKVSKVGEVSPYLSKQWQIAKLKAAQFL